jgi:hypothetical protein
MFEGRGIYGLGFLLFGELFVSLRRGWIVGVVDREVDLSSLSLGYSIRAGLADDVGGWYFESIKMSFLIFERS